MSEIQILSYIGYMYDFTEVIKLGSTKSLSVEYSAAVLATLI